MRRSLTGHGGAEQHAEGAGLAVQLGDARTEGVGLQAVHKCDWVGGEGGCRVHALIVFARAAENDRGSGGISGIERN
jgi:hypothetical protein